MDKKLDSLPSKELLYSELLNTSVTEHVQELLQKKEKSSTFPVQKSSVLGRASKLLQSFKENENDVQNIEIIEEGKPVIDMNVTLVNKDEEYEYESDSDTSEDFEYKTKDRKIICYDSDSDISANKNEEMSSDSESESEDCIVKDIFPFSNVDIKDYERRIKAVIKDLDRVTSSDSDDNTQESKINILNETKLFTFNSNREQFGNKNSKSVLEVQNNDKFVDSNDEPSNIECQENQEKILEHPKLDLELKSSVIPDSKYNDNCLNNNLDVSGERKRKLISVIEEGEEQPPYLSIKQKKV